MRCPHCGSSMTEKIEKQKNYDTRVEVIDTIYTCKSKECGSSVISSTTKDLYNGKKTNDR